MTADFTPMLPSQMLRGKNYGDWIAEWSNWIMSEQPDNYDGADILFLRGNVDYHYDSIGQRLKDPGGFLNKMEDRGYRITADTAVFIPVITAMFRKVDRYEGRQTSDERNMRYAARKDIFEGTEMWLVYKKYDDLVNDWPADYQNVVSSLYDFIFETRLFTLYVDTNSPLRQRLEEPLDPGEYEAVTHGYVVILTDFQPGTYRFKFGGKGRDEYYTHSGYDISVEGIRVPNSLDLSTKPLAIPNFDITKLKTTPGRSFKE